MTAIKDRKESLGEVPEEDTRRGRTKTMLTLAIVIIGLAGLGIGWLVLRDSGEVSPNEDSVVSTTLVDETVIATELDFPTGRFVNRDGGWLYILRLNDDGTYAANDRGNSILGTYRVDGDLFIELTHDSSGPDVPGEYHWTFENNELKFTMIEDSIPLRNLFYSRTFVAEE